MRKKYKRLLNFDIKEFIFCKLVMDKIGYLFFGRLEDEKGFGEIIKLIKYFLDENGVLPFEIFVFGKGKYENKIKELSDISNNIHYFGYQPLKTIYRYVCNCRYCLMPSKVVETFGLSALNSLAWGLPVVGYKNGGLENFVFDELNLENYKGENLLEKLKNFIKQDLNGKILTNNEWQKLHKKAIGISDDFHLVEWERKVNKIMDKKYGDHKKVLLVTDFASKIGGIEEHVLNVKSILGKIYFDVDLIGNRIPVGFLGKIWKILGVSFFANFNIIFALRLLWKIKKNKPNIIRFHSVLRQIGWFSFWLVGLLKKKMGITVLWTIHDMGYFYPLPSHLRKISDLCFPLNKKNFFKMMKNISFIKKIFLCLKFFNIILLKKFSKKNVDKFLVPSSFLKNIVEKSYELEKGKIVVLEHFLDE